MSEVIVTSACCDR